MQTTVNQYRLLTIVGNALNGGFVPRVQFHAACGLLRKLVPSNLVDAVEKAITKRLIGKWSVYERTRAEAFATPPWADIDAIKAIKRQCRRVSNMTGISHHVDHVIPLKGKLVCGLHCAENMQIITALDNLKKLNKYDGG
jgi:hypothetical protein